jgi:uncharacterized protein YdiU (UPF0061 family)
LPTATFADFAQRADYSLLDSLRSDPQATADGHDHRPRQVFSGHYVPVTPTPIPDPQYVAHSPALFHELGLSEELAHDDHFRRLFSGDISVAQGPMRPFGWATGYALSIYGSEYVQQCPFGTGNGYGDGRAISVFEGVFQGRRWEMQLKGGGPTPYCRGADGRAVLRSSVREFLAQEFMHALGVPTTRSLTLYVSRSETVRRPWYAPNSRSLDPDILVDNFAAITTRVAPSFLRVGQLELFARRARSQAHPQARQELQLIVQHLIERNYRQEIDANLPFGLPNCSVIVSRPWWPTGCVWVTVRVISTATTVRWVAIPSITGLLGSVNSLILASSPGPVVVSTSASSTNRRLPKPTIRCSGHPSGFC